jgi:penicillin-binding protein-related factor A (putative recombinase)
MIAKEDKIYLINYKIDFWRERLQESINSVSFLENHGDQIKIDMNNQDIIDYSNIIMSLENILDELNA